MSEEFQSLLNLEKIAKNYVKNNRHNLFASGAHYDCPCTLCRAIKAIDAARAADRKLEK